MRRFAVVACCALALLTASCGSRRNQIVIGSKNFTEQLILGELLAQQLERKTGLAVERRFYLAGTYICQQALLAGRIDMYVEYTGTALTAILKEKPSSNHQEVYERVKEGYARQFGLSVGEPLGFDNTFAMVIRGDDAQRLNLRTLSQAANYALQWRLGTGYEFKERPDGYAGLVRTYGLHFEAPPRIMDLGLLYRALKEKQVDIVAGSATDGLISALGFVVLEDDRHYFPPYDAVPIARAQVLRQHPEVKTALAELAGKISAEDMRRMNYAVDGEHQDAKQVAAEFLRAKGL
ncbi:MAG TPA: glycine betaine ABC transporter substrate-binding protein [Terriglobales bacterium]|nr:glycine betaine ABC transporter substrate-binding protein [Terriglobales bacterium]